MKKIKKKLNGLKTEKRLETIKAQDVEYEKLGKEFEEFHLPRIQEAFANGELKYIFKYHQGFPKYYIKKNSLGHQLLFSSIKPIMEKFVYERYVEIYFKEIIFTRPEVFLIKEKTKFCILQ